MKLNAKDQKILDNALKELDKQLDAEYADAVQAIDKALKAPYTPGIDEDPAEE